MFHSTGPVGVFEQVATGTNGANGKAQWSNTTTHPQHMDIQGVSARRTIRPPGICQLGAMHDGAKPINEGTHDPRFHRGKGGPGATNTNNAIGIDGRWSQRRGRNTATQGVGAGCYIVFIGWETDPVFKGVDAHRRCTGWLHQQQPGPTPFGEETASLVLMGPMQQFDLHLSGHGPTPVSTTLHRHPPRRR